VTAPQTALPVPLSAPVGGVNFRDPLVDMEQIYAPKMVNFTPEARHVESRKPWKIHASSAANAIIRGLGAWKSSSTSSAKLFALVEGGDEGGGREIWDMTTATTSLVVNMGVSAVSDECYPAYFNANMALITEYEQEIYRYDGSAWTGLNFTYSGSAISGRVVVSYKGRVYLFTSRLCYWTTTIGAVQGATARTDFGNILESAEDIAWAGVISSPSNVANSTYLAFGTYDGEVLVYGGDYPDSSSWGLVGRYRTAPIIDCNTVISIQNDILLLTTAGVVSLRDLMGKGSVQDQDMMLSANIGPYWTAYLSSSSPRPTNFSAAYWPEEDKLFILAPGSLYYDAYGAPQTNTLLATMFVLNMQTRAWGIHQIASLDEAEIGGLTYMNNNLYFFASGSRGSVVMTINKAGTGESAYKDEIWDAASTYQNIAVDLQTAPVAFGSKKKVHGFEVVMTAKETGAGLNVSAISDLGRSESAAANVPLTGGYAIPHYGVGALGRYVQARISGNLGPSIDSTTAGLKIYSLGVIAS
jgi:hypothetical protein